MLAAARAVPGDMGLYAEELVDLATGDRDLELRAALFALTDLLEKTASDREPAVRASPVRRSDRAARSDRSTTIRARKDSAHSAASITES